MEQKNESMRERLLARMPQPENLAAYREEDAVATWPDTRKRFAGRDGRATTFILDRRCLTYSSGRHVPLIATGERLALNEQI